MQSSTIYATTLHRRRPCPCRADTTPETVRLGTLAIVCITAPRCAASAHITITIVIQVSSTTFTTAMAFRQQHQRPQVPRLVSYQQQDPAPPAQSQQRKRPLEESQHDWILFSPPSQTNTSQTPRTADLSRASYFGSLDTSVRSDVLGTDDHIVRQVTISNNEDAETELDSLDDGLHAFEVPVPFHLDQSGGAVLPTHDGLGAFPMNGNPDVLQEQLWQHERYNPQRRHIHRRLSSVQRRLDSLDENGPLSEMDPHQERRLRVERWRVEQSQAVLEEIDRETRRRLRRMDKSGRGGEGQPRRVQNLASSVDTGNQDESESFWQRVTRTVIRDLMGLDENTLSVIFGEDLSDRLSSTPTQHDMAVTDAERDHMDKTWEERLLERVARELGILVYQLSELESAFTTYRPSTSHSRPTPIPNRPSPLPIPAELESAFTSTFRPTLNRTSPLSGPDASLWGIDEESPGPEYQDADLLTYWERNPSLLMIFTYLRRRLISLPTSTTQARGPLPASWATHPSSSMSTSPDSLRRADLIRRTHPLVPRASDGRRGRDAPVTAATTSSTAAVLRRHRPDLLNVAVLHRRQGSSSCASQSTKRSRRSSGTGQSRKYWDFGASETGNGGSAVTSAGGGMGVAAGGGGWDEV